MRLVSPVISPPVSDRLTDSACRFMSVHTPMANLFRMIEE